jgi:hypothetical protein
VGALALAPARPLEGDPARGGAAAAAARALGAAARAHEEEVRGGNIWK